MDLVEVVTQGTGRSFVAVAIALSVMGCGRLGFDALGGGGSFDASSVDASDGQLTDASGADADDGAAAPDPCRVSGNVITPIRLINVSPMDATTACNIDNAGSLDGQVTGLDLHSTTDIGCAVLDDRIAWVCGCVAADFGAEFEVDQLQLRMGATADACGTACSDGACDTGHEVALFAGHLIDQEFAVAEYVELTSGRAMSDYVVDAQHTIRYVIVCREAWGLGRDDVVVDAIAATCR